LPRDWALYAPAAKTIGIGHARVPVEHAATDRAGPADGLDRHGALLVDGLGDRVVDDGAETWLEMDALAEPCETPPDATPDVQATRHIARVAASDPRTTIVLFTAVLF
jgi:hypothetical protein